MSNRKFPSQKYRLLTRNIKKREKFLQPLIKDDDDLSAETESFFSIVKNKKEEKRELDQKNYYVSPMRGRVPNRATFPIYSSRGNISKQYDFIRPKEHQKEPEFRNNFGEFKLYTSKRSEQTSATNPTNQHNHDSQSIQHQSPFVFTEHITFDQPTKSQTINREPEDSQVSQQSFQRTHREPVNVLYEEEIELNHDRSVITSYDENNNHYYFGDYEKYHLKQENPPKQHPQKNIQITDYSGHDQKVLREIQEIFSDVTTQDTTDQRIPSAQSGKNYRDPIFFEENLELSELEEVRIPVRKNTYPNQSAQPTRGTTTQQPNQRFQDLKRELDMALNQYNRYEDPEDDDDETPSNSYVEEDYTDYQFPPLELLNPSSEFTLDQSSWANEQLKILDETLESFGIPAHTVSYTIGPSVTRFEIEPEPGTKVSRITSLTDDIQLRLAAKDIFVKAPIAGKSTVGIEIPNIETRTVNLREILESSSYQKSKSPLKIALGLDITGEPIFSDISAMTHTLIAGSTGSGKSVCINGIIVSILYNALPSDVKLVLIDPKKVEFAQYRDIPHLLTPVINDPKEATATLKWLTEEMDRRYELIESVGARDIRSYNIKRSRSLDDLPKLPYIVVIIDELADLMMVAMSEVEEYIQRIAQLARAAGIHLIVATQRPSANVITGTIKTNIPSRIAFKVSSQVDSRIILDTGGAERLIGKGDMLFIENGKSHMIRLQGSYISDDEIERITDYCRLQATPNYQFFSEDLVKHNDSVVVDYEDDLFDDAVRFVIELGEASASRLQRHFKVGYNRAARMIDMMEQMNIIAPHTGGSKPRDVLMTLEEYERLNRNVQ